MHADLLARIAEITDTPSSIPDPLHPVIDPAKRDALVEAMEEDGWTGAPIVVLSEVQALTGAHRIAAAVKADAGVPRVAVDDLCGVFGVDWPALLDEHGDWYLAAATLRGMLPADVVAYLGYDVDGV